MKSVCNKSKFQHQKLKTLCTLDSSDIVLVTDKRQIIDKNKNQLKKQKRKKNSILGQRCNTQIGQNQIRKQKNREYINQQWQNSLLRTKTPKTQTKQNRLYKKSRQRINTQYHQSSEKRIVLNNLQIFTTVKNIKFQMDEQYNIDPYHLVNVIKKTNQQTVSKVKYLDRNQKVSHFIMKKSNHQKTVVKYLKQIAFKQKLTDLLQTQQKKNFSCIYKVYRKDRHDNMFLVYQMQGQPLSWKNSLHKKMIRNLPKNNMEIIKHLIVQISKAIYILSNYGFYHSQIQLKNIFVELKQDDENVKVSKVVKLGNLYKCQSIKDKKLLQKMNLQIHTPPQIVNFIIFQKQNKHFNRSWLQYIYKYQDGWRIDVWSLGILILQLLNQQPISNSFLEPQQIIQYQKNVISRLAYLFDKISDQPLLKILQKMLSTNPLERPSPQQIIIALTS